MANVKKQVQQQPAEPNEKGQDTNKFAEPDKKKACFARQLEQQFAQKRGSDHGAVFFYGV